MARAGSMQRTTTMEEGGVSPERKKKTMGMKARAKSITHKYLVVRYACKWT